jgi:zinc transport system substrate-binding protein
MIWEGEPEEETVERLRALGVESVVVNPCPNRPPAGDFLAVMTENARSLAPIFGQLSEDP